MIRTALLLALILAAPASAQPRGQIPDPPPAPVPVLQSETIRRYKAPEASQGVAVDARHFYAVSNSRIAKYGKVSGTKISEWTGERARFPHLNSCEIIGSELVCANSNFPDVPMTSSVEFFDPVRMVHLRTASLGQQVGSLTWVDRRDGAWFAAFANYDERGGEPGRDHRFSQLVQYDDQWRRMQAWSFPAGVLARFKPTSSSGGGFGDDGLLYVTGHDHTELYVLRLPKGSSILDHVATINVPVEGQAIAFDKSQRRVLFGISRPNREVISMRLPPISAKPVTAP